jgi:hypothetical protein
VRTTRAHDLLFVIRNLRYFQGVLGLEIENWTLYSGENERSQTGYIWHLRRPDARFDRR